MQNHANIIKTEIIKAYIYHTTGKEVLIKEPGNFEQKKKMNIAFTKAVSFFREDPNGGINWPIGQAIAIKYGIILN